MKRIMLLILILILLTSCWNRREMNEMTITYGLGIDKEDEEYVVTAQVINPQQVSSQNKGGSGSQSPVIIHEEKDKSILNAIRKLSKTASRKIYVAHLYILVIGEAVAKEGLGEVLDLIYRDPEFRTDFYVFLAKDIPAKEILATPTPFSVASTNEIYDRIRYSNRHYSPTKATKIKELIIKSTSDGVQPVLPSLFVKKSTQEQDEKSIPEPEIVTGNLAVFNQDKLSAWLNEEQASTYNAVINNINRSVSNFPCGEEGNGVLEADKMDAKVKPVYKEKPKVEIEMKYEGTIAELDCNQKTLSPEDIRQLEKEIAKYLEEKHIKNMKEIQEEIGLDIFGFGREFFRKKPQEWKKMKKNWQEEFSQLEVKVSVEVHISGTGATQDTYLNQLKGDN